MPRRPERRPLLVAAGLGAATAVVAVVDPRRTHLIPPCPFHAVTGLDCPLCGGTRAVHDLVHLDLGAAAGQNLLVVALAPLVAVAVLAWVIGTLRPTRWRRLRARAAREPQRSPRGSVSPSWPSACCASCRWARSGGCAAADDSTRSVQTTEVAAVALAALDVGEHPHQISSGLAAPSRILAGMPSAMAPGGHHHVVR